MTVLDRFRGRRPFTRLRLIHGAGDADPNLPPKARQAECCLAHADEIGRLPIGFCSPGCVRRLRARPGVAPRALP